ncbi:hypothetical protein [Salipiger thiooxidans]|jgi:hypothetical protein|uniref:hypothetical protein n=1 Tax=Salipiger thiooxidans TaxID=282683 RepID=UPI001CD556E6|nr:hypothetical protein [Salipiger thiooxidans]MCA0846120.1 hypothetical protein [Salipiger thiooxidans]
MHEQLLGWCRGDEEAARFVLDLYEAIQEWDDLEDEGRCKDANALLSWLAFRKEYDPFFLRWGHILRPVMLSCYLQWRASNVLDRGDKLDVAKSYMLRAAFYQVIHVIAWIIGGHEWAEKVGPEIYRHYAETPDEIWKEFNDA